MNPRRTSEELSIIISRQDAEREYWYAKMEGEPEKSIFYYDRGETNRRPRQMESYSYRWEGALFESLMGLSNRYDYTLYMVLLSGLIHLLDRYSHGKDKDIIIGSPIYRQESEGEFMNTVLPLRSRLPEGISFKELLLQVKDTVVEADKHKNFPIEGILRHLGMEPDESGFPLFDIALLLSNIHDKEYISHIPLSMVFSFHRGETAVTAGVEYDARRYRASTIEGIVEHYTRLLEAALGALDAPLSSLTILSEAERRRLVYDFNAPLREYPYPREKTLDRLFEEQAQATPDRVAVFHEEGQVTFGELHRRSLHMAAYLRARGVRPGAIAAVMSGGTPEMLAAILGLLRAGGAYLPISAQYPDARKRYLLADSGVNLLLTDAPVTGSFLQDLAVIDVTAQSLFDGEEPGAPEREHGARDLAYIMYTSGSTGIPKGALIEHISVVRLVKNTNFVEFREGDGILKTGAMEFDASTFEIWGALLNGLRLYLTRKEEILIPGKLKQHLYKHHITTMWMTSPLFNQMADADIEIFRPPRQLLVGGDVLSPPHINRVRGRFPGLKVINGYGPTENTTFSTTHVIDRDYTDRIPIGAPIANSSAYILDCNNNPVPMGAVGELVVGGDGVGRGYLNDPVKTSERFLIGPIKTNGVQTRDVATILQDGSEPVQSGVQGAPPLGAPRAGAAGGNRLYKTGDLARWLPDGTIDFLGRIDFQVKIRGFRVELGEIETRLLNHGDIREAIVIARKDDGGVAYLCAYVAGERELSAAELREYLAGQLPDYMVPGYFVWLEKLPLTPNGKVDRRALPEPKPAKDASYTAPSNQVEERLVELFGAVLRLDKNVIGVEADFFDLGGHSLKANILVAEIQAEFNVKVPLAEVFTHPTVRALAQVIGEARPETFAGLQWAEEREVYPLSTAQKRLYVLHQVEPDGVAYNMPQVVHFPEGLEIQRLKETLNRLVERHESLRTSFFTLGVEPVQRVHDYAGIEVPVEHRTIAGGDPVPAARQIIDTFMRPFDLGCAPLLRASLLDITGFGSVLLLDIHHIVGDGASQALLTAEFNRLYSGEGGPLPAPALRYRDYAVRQQGEEYRTLTARQGEYWLKQFQEDVPVLELPYDFPRPAVRSFEGGTVNLPLETETLEGLQQLARQKDMTPYMVLLAFFYGLLHRLGGQEDIVVGTPVSGRLRGDLMHIAGMFVNTLALRCFPRGDRPLGDFLEEVKTYTLQAFENQEYPLEELLEGVDIPRDLGRGPLFDVMFALEQVEPSPARAGDVPLTGVGIFAMDYRVAKFDLSLTVMQEPGGMVLSFEYCTRLFREDTVRRFGAYFTRLLEGALEEPSLPLGDILILGTEEREQVLSLFNDTQADFPGPRVFAGIFQARVEQGPDLVAVSSGESRLSYACLNRRANRLASVLRERGVVPGSIVGLMGYRGLPMLEAILAVLKSGGAYLPIYPGVPADRIRYILADSRPHLVLLQGQTELPGGGYTPPCLHLEEPDAYANESGGENPGTPPEPGGLAYIIYTSGTTGKPKGVLVEQQNLTAYVRAFLKNFPLGTGDNIILESSLAFDAFVEEFYPPLARGASVCVARQEEVMDVRLLESFIARQNITQISCSPLLLNELNRLEDLSSLRCVHTYISGADVLNPEYVDRLMTQSRLFNVYGPTESTVAGTLYRLPDPPPARVPVGSPIANYRLYVASPRGQLQGIGITGEILVAGDGVARGYLNRPQLTAEKFTADPFLPHPNAGSERLYHTGDLGRWLPDGNIEFQGRIDSQVKIRGFRIELGEIESHLLNLDVVREAVVVAGRFGGNDISLCAYVAPGEDESIDTGELRGALSGFLPSYMVPAYFVTLERLPLTSGGKVNRRVLPRPQPDVSAAAPVPPQTPLEIQVARLWAAVLGVEESAVGLNSRFFDMGGHSLKGNLLAARIEKEIGVKISLVDLLKASSLSNLVQCIHSARKSAFVSIEAAEPREFYPLSAAQRRLHMLQQLNPAGTAYNMPVFMELEGVVPPAKLQSVFLRLIERHEGLRTSFQVRGEVPVQEIRPAESISFEIETYDSRDLLTVPGSSSPSYETLITQFTRPFALIHAPLLRVGVSQVGDNRHFLMVDMHHIVSDGTSTGILIEEFLSLYGEKPLPPLRIHYKDYALWEENQGNQGTFKSQEAYWLRQFRDEIPVLDLPTDYPRPRVLGIEGGTVRYRCTPRETEQLKQLALEQGVTLYMVLLALYYIFLSRLSSQQTIVVGTPVTNRPHADLERVIGMFVNTLALGIEVKPEKTFLQFLAEVEGKTLAAFSKRDYQYDRLVDNVVLNRDAGRNPLFDAMFILQNLDTGSMEIPGLKITPYEVERTTSKFDFTWECIEQEDHLEFIVEYSTRLFKEETVYRFIGYLDRLMHHAGQGPRRAIAGIDLLTDEEKQMLVVDFNDTAVPFPSGKTVYRLFEEQVDLYPDHPALAYNGHEISFSCFDRMANRLAHVLRREYGVVPGAPVAVVMERSLELIITLMAIMKSGAAYVPLDPSLPLERLRLVLRDASVAVMCSREALREKLTPLRDMCRPLNHLVCIDGIREQLKDYPDHRPDGGEPSGPAYVMYTSGSTGTPKGVLVEHRTIINTLVWRMNFYEYRPGCVSLQNPPYFFDSSVTDIFTPLIGGAKLVLIGDKERVDLEILRRVIKTNKVTHFIAVPAFYNILIEEIPDDLTYVKMVCVAGEHFPDELVKKHFSRLPRVRIVNEYGPTENSVNSTAYELRPGSEKALIGKPISNVGVLVLDRHLQLCPLGVTGEMCLSGSSLARGYLNNPEITAEKFITLAAPEGQLGVQGARHGRDLLAPLGLPEGPPEGTRYHAPRRAAGGTSPLPTRVYRTGDLARWLPGGNLEFVGRVDTQVKIRGIRVEVAEIENHLLKRREIKEAVVLAHEGAGGDKFLCAYVVTTRAGNGAAGEPGAPPPPGDRYAVQLKEYLTGRLPEYMVPAHVLVIDAIPFTPGGKIDRRALPVPELTSGEITPPRTAEERGIAEIWAGVLGVETDSIGIDCDFFKLGGHSLRATTIVSRVHKVFNVKIPLAELFVNPTIRGLARYMASAGQQQFASLQAVEKKKYYSLSPAQRRIYVLQYMDRSGLTYNLPTIMKLEGAVDMGAIEETFLGLIGRHESLRTSIRLAGEDPFQVVHQHVEFELERYRATIEGPWSLVIGGAAVDAHETPSPNSPREIINNFIRPFDLFQAPLLRAGLIKAGGQTWFLMLDMHHIIADGTSMGVLIKDFIQLYEGKIPPPLRVQYKDYAEWQNSGQARKLMRKQENFWLKEFQGEVPVLELPADFPRPKVQSFEGGAFSFRVDPQTAAALNVLALEQGVTLYMLLLSIYNIFLSRVGSREEVVVGTVTAGRPHADLLPVIGMFINTLALRNRPAGNKTFLEFLGEVKQKVLDVFANQDYPYEELVEKLGLDRDTSRNPLFDTVFALQNLDIPEIEIPGLTLKPCETDHGIAKFDLMLQAMEVEGELLMVFEYGTRLFREETVARFSRYFTTAMHRVLENPGGMVSGIEILPEEEKHRLLFDFCGGAPDFPSHMSIYRLFAQQVQRTPDREAVNGYWQAQPGPHAADPQIHSLSFRELDQKATQLAHHLRELGVRENRAVGLLTDRSVEMIVGILGIWRAGGAYVPLNPKAPAARNGFMLKETAAGVLLTSRRVFEGTEQTGPRQGETVYIEESCHRTVGHDDHLPGPGGPGDLAYVIFTSGSTGVPKGVLISHSNLCPLLQWGYRELRTGSGDRALQNLSYYFDWSVWEMFITLTSGAALYMASDSLILDPEGCVSYMLENNISLLHITPTQYQYYIHTGRKLESLRYLFLGAEKLTLDLLRRSFQSVSKECRVFNMYGPTEATIICAVLEIRRGEEDRYENLTSVPIGYPVGNGSLMVLDFHMNLCPVGVTGELYIGGDGLAQGYLNDPEKTASVFVGSEGRWRPSSGATTEGQPSSALRPPPSRLYKTGDLVRWRPDRTVEFLGRIDHQVKIRGFRIELGEIENCLLQHALVKEAVVIDRKKEDGDPYLVAYLVPGEGIELDAQSAPDMANQLREHLTGRLPDYMIPPYFMPLAKFPLNANGKVDRRALPEPEYADGELYAYVPPADEVEAQLAELWGQVLGIDKDTVSVEADFFHLGGHSLKAANLMNRIQKAFDIKIELMEIFSNPTIRGAATLIKAAGWAGDGDAGAEEDGDDMDMEELVI